MKIVYVLSSDKSDYYYEELLLSVYSLRRHNKNVEIIVLCDNITYNTLKNKRRYIYDVASVIQVETPSKYNKMQRGRYVKTMVRELVTGDYLYIDNDTIVCQDLSAFDPQVKNIGAVYDWHNPNHKFDYSYLSSKELEESSDISSFNSGVLLVRDTDESRKLYKEWHRIWTEKCDNGINRDQPALRMAQHACGVELEKIDDTWNCMITTPTGASKPFQSEAIIIHYFHALFHGYINHVLDKIKSTGRVSNELGEWIDTPIECYLKKKENFDITEMMILYSPMAQMASNYPNAYSLMQRHVHWFVRLWTTMSRVKRKIWH